MDAFGNPLMAAQMMAHMAVGERKLDYYAMGACFENRMNVPSATVMAKQIISHATDLIEEVEATRDVHVKPSDRESESYLYVANGEDGEPEVDDWGTSEEGYGEMAEYDYRHPGTSYDSDDEALRGDNEIFSPINTKAAQHLHALAFAGGVQSSAEATPAHAVLRAAYKLQLSVRVDDQRRQLNFDCYEYKPSAVDPEHDDCLPTVRSVERFDACTGMGGGRGGGFGMDSDDDDDDDDDDPALDEIVRPRDGGSFDGPTRLALLFRATVGDFLSARLLRFRVPLASVVGARLVVSQEGGGSHGGGSHGDDGERSAALVLELDAPPPADAFAARKVHSKLHGENRFALVDDWTPHQAASRASRIYIFGDLKELRQIAAHLATLSTQFAALVAPPAKKEKKNKAGAAGDAGAASPPAVRNTLAPPASLLYATAPVFGNAGSSSSSAVGGASTTSSGADASRVPSLQSLSAGCAVRLGATPAELRDKGFPPAAVGAVATAETEAKAAARRTKLSVEEVHALLVERGLVTSSEEAERVNPCLKRGILLGHVTVREDATRDTPLHVGGCVCCGQELICTIGDALWQSTYGGDYEDGGQDAAVQCEECCGNYITALCTSRPHFDSGKFHNHCTECPDFGECIYDYRNQHCDDCGAHYFAGLSGFACPDCGGGCGRRSKATPLKDLPPPDPSSWDGMLTGLDTVLARLWPTLHPMQQIMLTSAGCAPASAANAAPGSAGGLGGGLGGGVGGGLGGGLGAALLGQLYGGLGGAGGGGEDDQRRMAMMAMMMQMLGGGGDDDDDDDDEDDEDDDDDDDDDSDGDRVEELGAHDPAAAIEAAPPKNATVAKYRALLADFEQSDLTMLFFETPAEEDSDTPEMVTRESLLGKHHLLLPTRLASIARDYSRRASQLVHSHMGGGTSLGNAMWHRFMRPALAAARRSMGTDWAAALGHLLGLVMIGINDDTWLLDQEEYCEWDDFESYFTALSATWQRVLAQPDDVLGLAPPRGKPEGYRVDLLRLLSGWETEVNDTLAEYDEFADGGKPARLTATKTTEGPQREAKGEQPPAATATSRGESSSSAPTQDAKASQRSPRETQAGSGKRARKGNMEVAPAATYDY